MADAISAGSGVMNEGLHVVAGPAAFKMDIDCCQYSSGTSAVSRRRIRLPAAARISCQIPRFIALLLGTCFRTRENMTFARFYFYFHFSYSSPRAVEKR
jgi:hypothetical protein